jgi:anti-sigma factor (TIGR02949 family)
MPLHRLVALFVRVRGYLVSCDTVADLLWDYLDCEIEDPKLRLRIEAHIQHCERCFPEHNYRKAFLGLVERNSEEPVPPGLRRSVFQQLLEIDAEDSSEGRPNLPGSGNA